MSHSKMTTPDVRGDLIHPFPFPYFFRRLFGLTPVLVKEAGHRWPVPTVG